jgi:hypothetical protein
VGKHAVLFQEFNVDLHPKDMNFNSLRVWARIIKVPFRYMHKRWGATFAGPLGIKGSVPVVDADASGRCWGSYMRVRVEVDVNKPLLRGVTIFSQLHKAYDYYEVQYEHLPLYCFSCGVIGHSSLECKNPGERDEEGKLPYSADSLCAPDDRKKKYQGAGLSSGSVAAGIGRASQNSSYEGSGQSANGEGVKQPRRNDQVKEVPSPVKKRQPPC